MKIKSKTYRQIIEEQELATKKEIMNILKMNEFEYNNTLFETGILWLKNINPPSLIDSYTQSKIFWKWYMNQYGLIDTVFIEKVNNESLYQLNTNQLTKIYFKLQIQMSFFPSRMAQKMILNEIVPQKHKIMQQKA